MAEGVLRAGETLTEKKEWRTMRGMAEAKRNGKGVKREG